MHKFLLRFPTLANPDVKGGLDSIKDSATPIFKTFTEFIGWGGAVICFFVFVGLLINVGVKRREGKVVDKESIAAIGIVLVIMTILGAIGVWSTFFLK